MFSTINAIEQIISTSHISNKLLKFEETHFKLSKHKMLFFLIIKLVVNVFIEGIHVVLASSGSNEQTNDKKYVDLDKRKKEVSNVSRTITQIKEKDIQLRKELTLWKENDYLCKKIIF